MAGHLLSMSVCRYEATYFIPFIVFHVLRHAFQVAKWALSKSARHEIVDATIAQTVCLFSRSLKGTMWQRTNLAISIPHP